MTIFEFVGKYFFQNEIFKLQEVFSELRIVENGLGSLQALFYRFETNLRCLKEFKNSFKN
jgi:hypothetical protein